MVDNNAEVIIYSINDKDLSTSQISMYIEKLNTVCYNNGIDISFIDNKNDYHIELIQDMITILSTINQSEESMAKKNDKRIVQIRYARGFKEEDIEEIASRINDALLDYSIDIVLLDKRVDIITADKFLNKLSKLLGVYNQYKASLKKGFKNDFKK